MVLLFLMPLPPTASAQPVPEYTRALGLENPSLGMGLNGISDWSTQHPFIDLMKSARPWTGHLPGQYGGMEPEEIQRSGVLDANGWPRSLPEGLVKLEALILTDQPKQAVSLAGRYRVRFQGSGEVAVTGRVENVTRAGRDLWFDYTPGPGLVGIAVLASDPQETGDHIRNITVLREDMIPLHEVGAIFNPVWRLQVADLRLIRFMDWMETNGSETVAWQDRAGLDDYTYGRRGVPVEIMVALANEINADPWFTIPHQANDEYIRKFAQYVLANLNLHLKAHVEYSNELWNFTFSQAKWAETQALAKWGSIDDGAWMRFAGLRAADVSVIWADVFGDSAPNRLIRVIAAHTGWPELEQYALHPENNAAEPPFDAYAISGYFGHEAGTDVMAPKILRWIEESALAATELADADGMTGAAKRTFIEREKYSLVDLRFDEFLKNSPIKAYLEDTLAYHASVAKAEGLALIMYEGGTHVVGLGAWGNDERLTDYFLHFNYSTEMGNLYRSLLAGWKAQGGTVFNAFVDVAPGSKWGSWGAKRYLEDKNPRHDALTEFNMTNPAWWGSDPRSDFADGIIVSGTAGADRIGGTLKADVLIGLSGDDEMLALGDGDRLHGGDGQDIAILPGTPDEYTFKRSDGVLQAIGPVETYFLRSIETIRFVKRDAFPEPRNVAP